MPILSALSARPGRGTARSRVRAISGVALLIVVALLFRAAPARAESLGEARQKYKNVQERIASEKGKIKESELIESATLDDLDAVNRKLAHVEKDLARRQRELEATGQRVRRAEDEVRETEARLRARKEWLGRRIGALHRTRGTSVEDFAAVLGSAESLPDLQRRMTYLGALAAHDRSVIEGYARDLARLDAKKRELKGLLVRQRAETLRVGAVERDLEAKKKSKENLLAVLARQKSASEHLLKELATAANQLREVIRRAEKEKSTFGGTGFQALKGRLPWPVDGEIAIPYGTTRDPRFETPVFRNGIYITAAKGVVTTAVYRGEVVFADWFKGYGHLVILNHGQGYHTLYANLSEIFLKKGDIIEEGKPVGRVGESGVLDRASLYFEIRYKGKALNPAHWLGSK